MHYIDEIEQFLPLCEQEEYDKRVMLEAAKEKPGILLSRENAIAHMTASSIILNENGDKTLMAYHNIYDSWAWTGGHADGESDLLALALREAREETGVSELTPIFDRCVSLEILHVPAHIKRGKYVGTHLHLNLSYALRGKEGNALRNKPDENSVVGWLLVSELDSLVSEKDMLPVYRKIISRITG